MIIHDQKGSWKGLLWVLFFIWPIFITIGLIDFKPQEAEMLEWIIIIALCSSSFLWLYILIGIIRKLK